MGSQPGVDVRLRSFTYPHSQHKVHPLLARALSRSLAISITQNPESCPWPAAKRGHVAEGSCPILAGRPVVASLGHFRRPQRTGRRKLREQRLDPPLQNQVMSLQL